MAPLMADYEFSKGNLPYLTVDRLKIVISAFNEQCGKSLTKSGRKQELVDRAQACVEQWRSANDVLLMEKARNIISSVKNNTYVPPHQRQNFAISSATAAAMRFPPSSSSMPTATTSSSSWVPPKRPIIVSPPKPALRFKSSPFVEVLEPITNVVECPESTSATDRRSQYMHFSLTLDQLHRLTAKLCQLRLFCTSSAFYSTSLYHPNAGTLCPIEFPPTCEVKVNGSSIPGNLKGMKKKPGTTPPPNLFPMVPKTLGPHHLEMVYVNSQQPVVSKKYFMVVMLVQTTSVEQLVARLKDTRRRSAADVKQAMQTAYKDDDDIVAGVSKMSLKCPLSYVRISTPARSSLCVHSQCFDALSWFSVMEQTTTWLCPVCEKVLDPNELILDGYFDEIVKATPESVEDVLVEPDGEWHTEDGKFGSAEWKEKNPRVAPPPPPPPKEPEKRNTPVPSQGPEITIVDSDEEDEGEVGQTLYRSAVSSQAMAPPRSNHSTDIIDLTLSDDEEDTVPPPPSSSSSLTAHSTTLRMTMKRKASDSSFSGPETWKKGRSNGPEVSPVVSPHSSGDWRPVIYPRYPGASPKFGHPG